MKKLILALALFLLPISAEAANKFWVGGTGTWDSTTTTHWSASTGGAGGAAVPGASDTPIFDGASGGGTVTVDTTINGLSFSAITAGAFTGTLDFSVNNPSLTLTSTGTALSLSGAGAGRIFKLGSGTFTFSNGGSYDFGTTTGAGAQSLASATLVFNGNSVLTGQQSIALGGFAYGAITINGRASGQGVNINGNVNGWSATTLNINGPIYATFATSNGTTTNLNIIGASLAQPVVLSITPQNSQIILTATTVTVNFAAIRNINFVNPATATNSWDLGSNTNLTVTGPSAGGGHIIGG